VIDANVIEASALAPVLSANPICYVDVGARGGFGNDLLPLAFCVDAIGFEPNPDEFATLDNQELGPWRSLQLLPFAISAEGGRQTLFVPDDPQAASLLQSDKFICAPFGKSQFFEPKAEIVVDTWKLSEILHENSAPEPDCLKLDIEGAEYGVLKSIEKLLTNLCVVKVEVAFLPFRVKHPVSAEIEMHMKSHGFELIDLLDAAHWRLMGEVIHPLVSKEEIPYSRGQLVHGDYLFFRSFASLNFETEPGRAQALKAAALAMSYGYFDHAARILFDPRMSGWLSLHGVNNVPELLSKVSTAYGRAAMRQGFARQLRGLLPFLRRIMQMV